MLSGLLRSARAVEVNIAIMRAFVRLRKLVASHEALALQLHQLEEATAQRFDIVFEVLDKLVEDDVPDERRIGFIRDADGEGEGG